MRRGLIVMVGVWLAAVGLARGGAPQGTVELRVLGRSPSNVWVVARPPQGRQRRQAPDAVRQLLRVTGAEVTPGPAGFDPTLRAAFVTWSEAEEGLWYSFSRDRGLTWTEPRLTTRTLELRDGATPPGQPMPPVPSSGALQAGGRLFIVQFLPLSLPEFRTALRAIGVEVFQHLPHNAHVVRVDPSQLQQVRSLGFVERIEPYHPWYRLEPMLREWLGSPADGPKRMAVRVLALEWGEAGKRRIAEAASALGAEVTNLVPHGQALELIADREQLRKIAAHDDVLWIDRQTPKSPDMDLVRLDTGTGWVEDNPGYCGTGVRGEVLDAGIQIAHQDFDGVLLHGPNGQSSHGTKVYGIVFGNGIQDGDGVAAATGMLPCGQGITADYEEPGFSGNRFGHTQALLSAPYFASFQSNSWGSTPTLSYTSASFELDDIAWRLDMAITQSQSNTGSQLSRPEAWAKNVISVGGIRHHNTLVLGDDDWGNPPGDCPPGGCASIGPAEDGRVKPDLAHWNDFIFTTTLPNGYADFAGTSASTPITAGVLGLVLEMWADNVWNTNPIGQTVFDKRPHASTLKALLINTAQQYPFLGPSELSRFVQGWGRPSSIQAWQRAATSFVLDEGVPLEVGEWASFKLDVLPGEGALKVTMVYPDPPGLTAATLHRINDVDLELRSPSEVIYRGNNGLIQGVWSTPGGAPNGIDTVENVFVENPEPGVWRARVSAVEVNEDGHLATSQEDDVAFALVATGATGLLCTTMQVSFTALPATATVGESVQFSPSVAGGAPGAKTYLWDFDDDGTVDSTDPAPVHVYPEPFSGEAQLEVRDTQGCAEFAGQAILVEGPRLVFDSYLGLTEVAGNGNGTLDPGETWDVDVRLLNDGSQTAVGVGATIVPGSNPGGVLVIQGASSFGNIGSGATAVGQESYRFRLGQGFPCGQSVSFTLTSISSATPLNVYPDEVDAFSLLVGGDGPPVVFWQDSFDGPPGWTVEGDPGEWQVGPPLGLGSPLPDPTVAADGAQVMGNDLTGQGVFPGNYENNVTSTLVSPAIDASLATDVQIRFARWLNTLAGDRAMVLVQGGGGPTQTLYNQANGVSDAQWTTATYDASAAADGSADFRVRFRIASDSSGTNSGWNIDRFEVLGVTPASCSTFGSPGAGLVDALTVDLDVQGDVVLEWTPDCGNGTGYSVYRGSLAGGYDSAAPALCDHPSTSMVLTPEAYSEFFFVAPSTAEFDGSYGLRGDGTERPELDGACHPLDVHDACP